MAKFVGFIGTISGKVGTTVFCKGEKGTSYGRAYQPTVQNPKSSLQVDQRAKMNLVGRMSQATPKALLVGMAGVTNRQRRSAFTSILLNSATVDHSQPGVVLAQMAPEDVVFSQGAEVLSATAATPSVSETSVSISLTLSDNALAGLYGERIVVAIIDPSDKAGYSRVVYKDQIFDDTTAKTVAINLGAPIVDESMVCIYRLPFVLNEHGASLVYRTLSNDATDITAKVIEGGNSIIRGWGNSVLQHKEVFSVA